MGQVASVPRDRPVDPSFQTSTSLPTTKVPPLPALEEYLAAFDRYEATEGVHARAWEYCKGRTCPLLTLFAPVAAGTLGGKYVGSSLAGGATLGIAPPAAPAAAFIGGLAGAAVGAAAGYGVGCYLLSRSSAYQTWRKKKLSPHEKRCFLQSDRVLEAYVSPIGDSLFRVPVDAIDGYTYEMSKLTREFSWRKSTQIDSPELGSPYVVHQEHLFPNKRVLAAIAIRKAALLGMSKSTSGLLSVEIAKIDRCMQYFLRERDRLCNEAETDIFDLEGVLSRGIRRKLHHQIVAIRQSQGREQLDFRLPNGSREELVRLFEPRPTSVAQTEEIGSNSLDLQFLGIPCGL